MRALLALLVATWFLFVLAVSCLGQAYHDPTLDSINNDLVYVDSDVNGVGRAETNLLFIIAQTAYQINTNLMYQQVTNLNQAYQIQYGSNALVSLTNVVPTNAIARGMAASNAMMNLLMSYGAGGFTNGEGNFDHNGQWGNSFDGDSGLQYLVSAGSMPGGSTFQFRFGEDYNPDVPIQMTPVMPAMTALGRLLLSIVWITFAVWTFETLREMVDKTLSQRQVQGSAETVLGTSASTPIGFAFALVATTAISSMVSIVLGLAFSRTGMGVLFASPSLVSQIQSMGVQNSAFGSVWNYLTSVIPISSILVGFFNYLAFRYFYGMGLWTGVRMIIFWLSV